jgi:hypothetical protein
MIHRGALCFINVCKTSSMVTDVCLLRLIVLISVKQVSFLIQCDYYNIRDFLKDWIFIMFER